MATALCLIFSPRRYELTAGVKWFVLGALFLSLWGCTFSHTAYQTSQGLKMLGFKQSHRVGRHQDWVLPANTSVYLGYPAVSESLANEWPRLRFELAKTWQQALEAKFQTVVMANLDTPNRANIAAANALGVDIVMELKVLNAEDHLSSLVEWVDEYGLASKAPRSVGRDNIYVLVTIVDVRSQKRLDSIVVSSKSSRLAYNQNTPQHLVVGAVRALSSRFGDPYYSALN